MLSNSVILLRHHISACTSVHVWRYQVILFSLCINSSVIALRDQSSRISYNLRLLSNIFPLQILSDTFSSERRVANPLFTTKAKISITYFQPTFPQTSNSLSYNLPFSASP